MKTETAPGRKLYSKEEIRAIKDSAFIAGWWYSRSSHKLQPNTTHEIADAQVNEDLEEFKLEQYY